jgi:hypothetical protein
MASGCCCRHRLVHSASIPCGTAACPLRQGKPAFPCSSGGTADDTPPLQQRKRHFPCPASPCRRGWAGEGWLPLPQRKAPLPCAPSPAAADPQRSRPAPLPAFPSRRGTLIHRCSWGVHARVLLGCLGNGNGCAARGILTDHGGRLLPPSAFGWPLAVRAAFILFSGACAPRPVWLLQARVAARQVRSSSSVCKRRDRKMRRLCSRSYSSTQEAAWKCRAFINVMPRYNCRRHVSTGALRNKKHH